MDNSNLLEGMGPIGIIIALVVAVFYIFVYWKIFEKAGLPGWGAIIPIYNVYLFLKVAKRPGWWLLLYLIPLVNIVIAIIVIFDIAKYFGKSTAFGFGLLFFSFIFYPILAFGSAEYVK
ncbi:MAG: signal peptidase I [Candidatus Aminicenantes bacterium]|nr:signal peptidase I [Candidatus Aminicenantes bacterium]